MFSSKLFTKINYIPYFFSLNNNLFKKQFNFGLFFDNELGTFTSPLCIHLCLNICVCVLNVTEGRRSTPMSFVRFYTTLEQNVTWFSNTLECNR